jgi:hypothetical protein
LGMDPVGLGLGLLTESLRVAKLPSRQLDPREATL